MMRPTRGLLAQVFVVLAIVSLASIALAPRGVVRAAVADDLDLGATVVDSPSIDASSDAIHLPGVRAMVTREEQDPHEALLDALTTGLLPGAAPAVVPAASRAVDTTVRPPAPPAPVSANGDRAPPSSI